MKECIGCKQTKPLDDFYRHPNTKEKRTPKCKYCMVEISKEKHKGKVNNQYFVWDNRIATI